MLVVVTYCNLLNKVCVSNKREDLNIIVFYIITRINESKTLTKHLSYECKCINGGIMINVDASVENVMYIKRVMFGILPHVIVKMENI